MTDREKAMFWLDSFVKNKEPMTLIPKQLIRLMRDALNAQPEIVRWNDCKWYDEQISMCDNCGLPREQTFFCADGKRKEDETI